MPIMVVYRSSTVKAEAFGPYEAELRNTPIPPEGLIHQVGQNGDESIVVDVWSARAPFEAWTEAYIKPALARHGLPYVEPQVFEVLALATHDGVDPFKVFTTEVRQPA